MEDDNQERKPRMRYVRYAVISLAALLVLSLGFAVIPGESPVPAPPTFTEQARAAALDDALALRAAGLDLAGPAAGDGAAAGPVEKVVTLLTFHARALLPPGSSGSLPVATSPGPSAPHASVSPPEGDSLAESPSPAPAAARTPVDLAKAIAASGSQRLRDAQEADGGMARLLAGAGTAQLLAAGQLAAAAGDAAAVAGAAAAARAHGAAPAGASPQAGSGRTESQEQCPFAGPTDNAAPANGTSGNETPAAGSAGAVGNPGTAGGALSAVLQAELEAVYGYQAAMPRLTAEEAAPASDFLEQHRNAVDEAEERLRQACQSAQPQPPGYVLGADFLAAPAAGLGTLEVEALPAYGDLVALAEGPDRTWAVSALRAAAARAVRWGADPGPVPGMVLDAGELPALPGTE